jgi:Spy/CpxP family protein refolding chaperone
MRTLIVVTTLAVLMPVTALGQVAVLVEKIQDLQLTDAQEAKIADIRKECRPKVQNATSKLGAIVRAEVDQVREVLTAAQREKLQDLKDEREDRRDGSLAHAIANLKELDLTDAEMTRLGDIRKEYRPRVQKAMKELDGLLTDAQKSARAEALKADKKRSEVVQTLQLTEAQKDKVAAVGREVRTLLKEELEQIRSVLDDGQKEKLQELKEERKDRVRDRMAHRIANFKDLNLTEDQLTKISNIRQEYRPKIHEAGNQLRAAIKEEVEQMVAVIKS